MYVYLITFSGQQRNMYKAIYNNSTSNNRRRPTLTWGNSLCERTLAPPTCSTSATCCDCSTTAATLGHSHQGELWNCVDVQSDWLLPVCFLRMVLESVSCWHQTALWPGQPPPPVGQSLWSKLAELSRSWQSECDILCNIAKMIWNYVWEICLGNEVIAKKIFTVNKYRNNRGR